MFRAREAVLTDLVLIDTPYPYDGVPPCREESVQRRVQLKRIYPVPVVLLHFISNHIGNLKHICTNPIMVLRYWHGHQIWASNFIFVRFLSRKYKEFYKHCLSVWDYQHHQSHKSFSPKMGKSQRRFSWSPVDYFNHCNLSWVRPRESSVQFPAVCAHSGWSYTAHWVCVSLPKWVPQFP